MKTLIIAEAGVNHNGDLPMARELIFAALESGADVVKFQSAVPSEVVSKHSPKAPYQVLSDSPGESQLEMAEKIHLSLESFWELKEVAAKAGIRMMVSGFGPLSNSFLRELDLGWWKVPSGEVTNVPYLRQIGNISQPVFLSTGMATLDEVRVAIQTLESSGARRRDITVLHCNSAYPTPLRDVNLRAMETMRQEFDLNVGYSDHTQGSSVAIAAVALGATVIEKHLTLDNKLPGPDQSASSNPRAFKEMVVAIRSVEQALGHGSKKPSASELENIDVVRRSLVANCRIEKGELLTERNVYTKRPAWGISASKWDEVIGQPAPKSFEEDDFIEL